MNKTLEALTNLVRSSTGIKFSIPMVLFRDSECVRCREVLEALEILDNDEGLFVTKMENPKSECMMVVVEVMQ